jgi:hypothetical protein
VLMKDNGIALSRFYSFVEGIAGLVRGAAGHLRGHRPGLTHP